MYLASFHDAGENPPQGGHASRSRGTSAALTALHFGEIKTAGGVRNLSNGLAWKRPEGRASIPLFAFSLIELLTSVTIMTVILIALYSVFNHTQRALRANVSQTDVLESGRAAMSLMVRELEQMTASYETNAVNFFVQRNQIASYFVQPLPGGGFRQNFFDDFFFMSRQTNKWTASSYSIVFPLTNNTGNNVVGALYRFSTDSIRDLDSFQAPPRPDQPTSVSRYMMYYAGKPFTNALAQPVIDGVIHFAISTYDSYGNLLPPYGPNGVLINPPFKTNLSYMPIVPPRGSDLPRPLNGTYYFINNGLPAYVELEMGIMEPHVLQQFKSIPSRAAATNFLAKHVGQVHLFRKRIPILSAPQ